MKRRDVVFEVGEFVHLKLHPCQMQFLVAGTNQKLVAGFFGTFEVLERIGGVVYKLQLPKTAKIHPVFHVSLLKRSVRPFYIISTPATRLVCQSRTVSTTKTNTGQQEK